MAGLPLQDWQFYVVTTAFLAAVWLIVRPLIPGRRRGSGCPNCADASTTTTKQRVRLTVRGNAPASH